MPPHVMEGPVHYFQIGLLHISTANLLVIVLMVLVFLLAVLAPMPRRRGQE